MKRSKQGQDKRTPSQAGAGQDCARVGAVHCDLGGKVLSMDGRAFRLLGLQARFGSPSEAAGQLLSALLPSVQAWQLPIDEVRQRGAVDGLEWEAASPDSLPQRLRLDLVIMRRPGADDALQIKISRADAVEPVQARPLRAAERLRLLMVAMNECHRFDDALEPALRTALDACEMDRGAVYLVHDNEVVLHVSLGLPEALQRDVERIPLSSELVQGVLSASPPANVREVSDQFESLFTESGFRHVYCMPLRVESRAFGFLALASLAQEPPCEESLRQLTVMAAELESLFNRLQVERALRHSEERHRTILETIEEGYYETDLSGNFIAWNASLCRMLGYDEPEMRGLSFRQCYAGDRDLERVIETYNHVYRTGESLRIFDWQYMRKDGSDRSAEISITVVRDAEGRRCGFRGIARDVTERKEQERALREAEATNRALLDAVPDSMIRFRRDGEILAFKADLHSVPLFVPRSRIVGANLTQILPPGIAAEALLHAERALERNALETFEFQLPWRNGLREYEGRVVVSGPDDVLTFVRDITERKQREQSLRQSEAQYRSLFDASADGILLVTLDSKIMDSNPAARRMFGYRTEEMLSLPINDLIPFELTDAGPEDLLERIREHGILFEAVGRRKDASLFPVEVSVLLTRIGIGQVAVVYVEDITSRKKAEQDLRDSELRYREIFDNANDIIYSHDLAGKVLSLNRAGELITGYTLHESRNTSALAIVAPEYRDLARRKVAEKLEGKDTTQYELEIIAKDGRRVPLEVSTRVIMQGGKAVGIQGVARDITERKRAEEEKNRLEAQIQHSQKLESLGVLAGGIAHDFNNLLVGILGNAGLVRAKLPSESPALVYARRIEEAAQKAADLTNQMLAYSGKGAFLFETLNIEKLAKEMAHLLEASISKKVTLRYEFEARLPTVKGDPVQLQQVIMNLITNASDAIGDGSGTITLRTRTMELNASYLAQTFLDDALGEGEYICLEVADSGSGMSEETQARIFDPFFTTKFAGRGLGLAAVLGIVRSHRGAIKVYSEPEYGTTFKVLLPAAGADERPSALHPSADEAEGLDSWQVDGATVLVADDGAGIREVASETLEDHGFKVLAAEDGGQAVELFLRHKSEVSLVLLDLTMPVLSGVEAFERISAARPDVPIVLSSGYTEQDVRDRFSQGSPTAFIQKPYLPADLLRTVRALLNENGKR